MRRSLEFCSKGDRYVLYVSTAVEPQKEARTRVSQTHEHEKRPQSPGSPSSQGPRAFDRLETRATRPSARLVFLKQGRFSRAPRSAPAQLGTQEPGGRFWHGPMSRTMSPGAGDLSFFLRASRDIEYVKQHGRRLSTACFNLLICRTEARNSRVGIVVGKRFGIAVRRNRVKRLFRELSRQVRGELAADHALLVFPKREALTLSFEELKTLWRSTLRRQGVLSTPEQR